MHSTRSSDPPASTLNGLIGRPSAYAPVEEDATRLLAVLEAALAESDAFDESVPAPVAEPRSQQFSVDYLSRLVDAVDVFTTAFEAWMETQVESDLMSARGLFPTAWPKDGSDPADVSRRALAVAEAAGAAAKAVPVTGAYVVVEGTGLLDPVANWSHVSQPKALLSPADVRLVAAQIKGRLGGMALDAEMNRSDGLPSFGPVALHQILWNTAAPYWTAHRYRVAVREAAESLSSTMGRGSGVSERSYVP